MRVVPSDGWLRAPLSVSSASLPKTWPTRVGVYDLFERLRRKGAPEFESKLKVPYRPPSIGTVGTLLYLSCGTQDPVLYLIYTRSLWYPA